MRSSALSILIAVSLVASFGAARATVPEGTELERGRQIYEQRCLECHGAEGRGDGVKAPFLSPRPGNLVSAAISAKSDRDLLKVIANGRARTAMPAWKDQLSEEDQHAVLRYIRSLIRFTRPLNPPPPVP
jgi:mono/diheme cytochrome c family protein